MSESITLPCGCRINEAYVLGMCGTHAQELQIKRVERERRYSEFRHLMDLQPQRRGGE